MRAIKLLLALLGVGIVAFISGPRVEGDTASALPDVPPASELGAWLTAQEADLPDITPGAEKSITWADGPGTIAPWAIVYLHGFSGTRQELLPVPDSLAATLSANVFYTRFTGHGRSGDALAEASLGDWTRDAFEAVAIGRQIGERVLLMGTSNGAAIAAWSAAQPQVRDAIDGLVLISPNFAPADPKASILLWPWGEQIATAIVGEERSWEPANARHGRYSTTRYPTRALLPMMATVRALDKADLSEIRVPVFIGYSSLDSVVSPAAIREGAGRIPAALLTVFDIGETSDPSNHVIAGDMLSPETNERLIGTIRGYLLATGLR